jgi:hypothetical protein
MEGWAELGEEGNDVAFFRAGGVASI